MEESIKKIIEQPILDSGYLLDSVMIEKENNNKFLRITIDKEDGYININDCVIINKLLNPLLDEVSLLDESYIVDICSKEKGCE
ncbi:MAG: hypothetical protein RSB71_01845 [Bacilli bacterium]